ncbi:MAG: hypothetical protein UH249_05880 [Acutalibacteraceae bacterium]|nr:hypothetical protein [Acutalibacteraceae bacterium]
MENNFDGLYLRLAKHEGKVEKSIEIALSLINRGFPDEDISEICELGIEKIQKLRKEEYHNLNQEETIENVQASGAFIRAAQIATSMLQDDFEVDMIEKYTGLSTCFIEKLKRDFENSKIKEEAALKAEVAKEIEMVVMMIQDNLTFEEIHRKTLTPLKNIEEINDAFELIKKEYKLRSELQRILDAIKLGFSLDYIKQCCSLSEEKVELLTNIFNEN